MAPRSEAISPLAFYGAPKSQLNAVLSWKNYFHSRFSFLGSLPVSIEGPLGAGGEGGSRRVMLPLRVSPSRRVGGQRSLAPPRPRWARQLPGLPRRRPSAAPRSRGVAVREDPGAPQALAWAGGQKQQFPDTSRKEKGLLSPQSTASSAWGGGKLAPWRAGGAPRLPDSPVLVGRGERLGEGLWEERKTSRCREVRKRSGCPFTDSLSLHAASTLVENSKPWWKTPNTPGSNNDKRNNNDSNDNAFPYIKT